MDEKNQIQEFSLEDILKEFGSDSAPEEQENPVAAPAAESPAAPANPAPAAPATSDMGDTQPLPKVTQDTTVIPPMGGDTIVIPKVKHDTIRMAPIRTAEEPAEEPTQTQRFEPVRKPEEPEPFSDGWEPEYEQPMGPYVPPQPIVFRPRSRLRELKRKLIAGPERRYYELSEQGVGKVQIAMILSLVVVMLPPLRLEFLLL